MIKNKLNNHECTSNSTEQITLMSWNLCEKHQTLLHHTAPQLNQDRLFFNKKYNADSTSSYANKKDQLCWGKYENKIKQNNVGGEIWNIIFAIFFPTFTIYRNSYEFIIQKINNARWQHRLNKQNS